MMMNRHQCVGIVTTIFFCYKTIVATLKHFTVTIKPNRIDTLYRGDTVPFGQQCNSRAVVCMIDICNFSTWCGKTKNPQHIYQIMLRYNDMMHKLLLKFPSLEKIELVGDCAMVLGWLPPATATDDDDEDERVVNEMIKFAMAMLGNIPVIKSIFNDECISIRIGIHKGLVYSGFVPNPRKYQVFGETVNIASRIESMTDNGTCSISDESLSNIHHCMMYTNSLGIKHFKGVKTSMNCTELRRRRKRITSHELLQTMEILRHNEPPPNRAYNFSNRQK